MWRTFGFLATWTLMLVLGFSGMLARLWSHSELINSYVLAHHAEASFDLGAERDQTERDQRLAGQVQAIQAQYAQDWKHLRDRFLGEQLAIDERYGLECMDWGKCQKAHVDLENWRQAQAEVLWTRRELAIAKAQQERKLETDPN